MVVPFGAPSGCSELSKYEVILEKAGFDRATPTHVAVVTSQLIYEIMEAEGI